MKDLVYDIAILSVSNWNQLSRLWNFLSGLFFIVSGFLFTPNFNITTWTLYWSKLPAESVYDSTYYVEYLISAIDDQTAFPQLGCWAEPTRWKGRLVITYKWSQSKAPNVITSKKRKTSFHLLLADLKSSQVAHFESPAPTFPGIPPPPPLLLHSLLLSTIFYIIILSSVSTCLLSLGIILLVFFGIGSRSK